MSTSEQRAIGPRRPLSRRVLASFAVVVLAFVATVAAGLTAQSRAAQDVNALSLGYLPLETALARARATQWTVAARLDRLLEDPRPGTTREWLETVGRGLPAIFTKARQAALQGLSEAPDAETRAFAQGVVAQLDDIEREINDGSRALRDLFGALEAGDKARAGEQLSVVSARERGTAERLDVLAGQIEDRRAAVVTGSVARDKRAIIVSVALALLSLIVAAVATREVRRRLAPLGRLTARAQAIAAGDRSPMQLDLLEGRPGEGPSSRSKQAPRDEIGELAVAFAAMVEGVATRDADLLRLRRRQEDIVNNLRAAILALRDDGLVEAANPAARALFGVEIGKRLGEVAPVLWELVEADVHHAIGSADEPPAHMGVVLQPIPAARSQGEGAASAHPITVDLRVVPMHTEAQDSGAARLALLVADDVSDAAAARQRALQAERLAAIGKMAAHITHEIRNPLSSIGLNVELLDETIAAAAARAVERKGEGAPALEEARRLLSAISREVGRLADVSEDYLRVARLPSPRFAAVDLVELLRDVLTFAGPELERARVAVELRTPGEPVVVAIDEAQVRQALLNLVRNAREAMEDGGKLGIELSIDDGPLDRVTLQVSDEGAGIDEALRGRIFDPFFTTKPTGTGLGLPLTKQILEAHGGAITYVPRKPRGSRFTLTFPRVAASQRSAASHTAA